jgi:hypothetical protein
MLNRGKLIPSLVVGLGGTGYRTLKIVKKKFFESKAFNNEVPQMVKFISFDTDSNIEKGKENKILSVEEQKILSANTIEILNNIEQHPYIDKWFPRHQVKTSSSHGAKQVRAVGRLAIFNNIDAVVSELTSAVNNITAKRLITQGGHYNRTNDDVPVNVFVVCSLCGGTGSGMFVDMAYIIREIFARKPMIQPNISANLMLPDAFVELTKPKEKARIEANGAASLKELDLFMERLEIFNTSYSMNFSISKDVGMNKPFNFCYLMSAKNIEKQSIIEQVIGEHIFHGIGTEFTKDTHSYLANIPTNDFQPISTGDFKGKFTNYSSIGAASCVIPMEDMINIYCKEFSSDLLDEILRYTKDNEHTRAKKERDILLERAELYPDRDTGAIKILNKICSVDNFKTLRSSVIKELSAEDFGDTIAKQITTAQLSNKELEERMETAVQEQTANICDIVDSYVQECMGHWDKGAGYLAELLDQVLLSLRETKNHCKRDIQEIHSVSRKRNEKKAADKRLRLMEEISKSWLFRKKSLCEELAGEYIKLHNESAIAAFECQRKEYLIKVINNVFEFCNNYRKITKNFMDSVERLRLRFGKDDIASHMNDSFCTNEEDWLLNRSVVDGYDLKRIYQEKIVNMEAYETHFIGKDGLNLPESWKDYSDDQTSFEKDILKYAKNILKEIFKNITIEDFLFEKSRVTERNEIEECANALVTQGEPLWKINNALYTGKTSSLHFLGIAQGDQERITSVVKSVLPGSKHIFIVKTKDPHRITITQSAHGAPLFALNLIEMWENEYNLLKETRFLHAITEKEYNIEWINYPFRPQRINKEEGVKYFTLGFALRFIQVVKVGGMARYFLTHTPGKKVDPDDPTQNLVLLGESRIEAVRKFIESEAIRKARHEIEKALVDKAGDKGYAGQVEFLDKYISSLQAHEERVIDPVFKDLKELFKLELSEINKIRSIIDKKRLIEDSEAAMVL